ncbi:MAG: hypothetical protein M5R40_03850 [Anaerolineae bacterium]|nr:hypothetical protein [Anaerolineae bacterium]
MLQQIIEERLVDYGLKLKHPRAMWRLGYFPIEEHFNQFPEHRCTADRVIVPDALERAMRQAEAFEAAIAPRPSPKGKEDATRDQLVRIRGMVENGDLEEAIDEFQKTDPSLARRMKSRYARTTKDRRKGTITLDEYRAQIFDLTDWLLQELEERLGRT